MHARQVLAAGLPGDSAGSVHCRCQHIVLSEFEGVIAMLMMSMAVWRGLPLYRRGVQVMAWRLCVL